MLSGQRSGTSPTRTITYDSPRLPSLVRTIRTPAKYRKKYFIFRNVDSSQLIDIDHDHKPNHIPSTDSANSDLVYSGLLAVFISTDSTLSETLRLTAAVMIKRAVLQDKTLRMASGQEYQLRQGDIVCLFPLLSPQMDPEIHRDPQVRRTIAVLQPIRVLFSVSVSR